MGSCSAGDTNHSGAAAWGWFGLPTVCCSHQQLRLCTSGVRAAPEADAGCKAGLHCCRGSIWAACWSAGTQGSLHVHAQPPAKVVEPGDTLCRSWRELASRTLPPWKALPLCILLPSLVSSPEYAGPCPAGQPAHTSLKWHASNPGF